MLREAAGYSLGQLTATMKQLGRMVLLLLPFLGLAFAAEGPIAKARIEVSLLQSLLFISLTFKLHYDS